MAKQKIRIDPMTLIVSGLSLMVLAALFAAGKGPLLRIAIPAMASFVALSLYQRRPAAFVSFALWCWFLTPFVRRVVDWRVGFADQNLVLLTPFLVSWVAILSLRDRQRIKKIHFAPFALCSVAIAYGFCIGMAIHPSGEVIYGLVNWASPMLLGLHIYLRYEDYEENLAAIQKTALWGLLLMGIYGIWQFYKPPLWDAAWLTNLPGGLENSTFGRPEPQQIRVWSTLNAPGPFANVIVALMFLVIPKRSIIKLPALAASLYALLLSLVRTAWLTGIIRVLYLAKNSNRKLFVQVLVGMSGLVLGVVLLANSSLDIPVLQDRFKSLGDMKNDESLHDRTNLYVSLTGEVLADPLGIGLNNLDFYKGYPLDSGPIRMLLSMGWFGTITYSLGILQIFLLMRKRGNEHNTVMTACSSVVVMFLIQLASGLTFISSSGAMFWIAVGLGLASSMHEPVRAATFISPKQGFAHPVMNRTRNVAVHGREFGPASLSSLEQRL